MADDDKGNLWEQLNQVNMAKIGRSQPSNAPGPVISGPTEMAAPQNGPFPPSGNSSFAQAGAAGAPNQPMPPNVSGHPIAPNIPGQPVPPNVSQQSLQPNYVGQPAAPGTLAQPYGAASAPQSFPPSAPLPPAMGWTSASAGPAGVPNRPVPPNVPQQPLPPNVPGRPPAAPQVPGQPVPPGAPAQPFGAASHVQPALPPAPPLSVSGRPPAVPQVPGQPVPPGAPAQSFGAVSSGQPSLPPVPPSNVPGRPQAVPQVPGQSVPPGAPAQPFGAASNVQSSLPPAPPPSVSGRPPAVPQGPGQPVSPSTPGVSAPPFGAASNVQSSLPPAPPSSGGSRSPAASLSAANYPSFEGNSEPVTFQSSEAGAPYLPIKGGPASSPASSVPFGAQTLAVSVARAAADPSAGSVPSAKPEVIPSAQSSVMSSSKFAQANRSANLEKMAATARSLENGGHGETPPINSSLPQSQSVDRFVPSPEALMDSLVTSTELPRDAVRRQVDSLSRSRTGVRNDQFPGAQDNGRRGEFMRKMAVSLGILCFMLAGVLLYYYYYSPYGPHNTNLVAKQFSESIGEEERKNVTGALTEGDLSNPDPLGIVPQPGSALAPGIKVHVAGAVNKPGLVTLPFEARIDDAIKAAGGFGPEADKSSVNLAKYVSDGDQIVVRSQKRNSGGLQVEIEQEQGYGSGSRASKKNKAAPRSKSHASKAESSQAAAAPAISANDAAEHTVAAEPQKQTPDEAPAEKGGGSSGGEVVFGKVNINFANSMELLQLRGVGPDTAEAIVKYRESLPNKAFTSVDQLQEVPGIGPAKLADMRAQVEL